jgi:DNA (cytosine-5)-methyltransferase 1
MQNSSVIDFCSGGGGIGAAFIEEGLHYTNAVEFDPENPALSSAIADLHDKNFKQYGCNLFRGSIQDAARLDFRFIENEPMIGHISLPCQNYSAAKTDAMELERDFAMAYSTIRFLQLKRPRFFTLEQVPGYARSQSWEMIKTALIELGYGVTFGIANAHDYDVPQDRERMIVIADREGRVLGLPARRPRLGWWSVLGDRIAQMKLSKLTATQQKDIDVELQMYPTTQAFLIQRIGKRNDTIKIRHQFEPCFTITKSMFSDGKGASRQNFLDIWVNGITRSLSIQDVAGLQTLPNWYQFSGINLVDGAALGNAVPVNLYRAVLQHIMLFT